MPRKKFKVWNSYDELLTEYIRKTSIFAPGTLYDPKQSLLVLNTQYLCMPLKK